MSAIYRFLKRKFIKRKSLYDILFKFGVPRKLVRLIKTCLGDTQSKVKIGIYLSSSFPIENGLKQGDALSPLTFNFALEYAIRKLEETRLALDMNSNHRILTYVDDVNLIGDDIRTIERNADVLLNACKDIGLVVNTGKTKYMEIGRHRGVIANAHIKIGSNSYEKVKTFKYLGSLLTNKNFIQEEIKCTCYLRTAVQ